MDIGYWPLLWSACGLVTITAALGASKEDGWRRVGRAATAVLFVVGGALTHIVTLATGGNYASFADPAPFQWTTDAWRAVVAPNQVLFIGMLLVFEAVVGVLALTGGRFTQLGYMGIIAFYSLLWLFGPVETVFVLVMFGPMWLLLRAERRAATMSPGHEAGTKRLARVA